MTELRVVDAFGQWHGAVADSGVEGTHDGGGRKIHDFPVIWVVLDGYPGRMPLAAGSVHSGPASVADHVHLMVG